MLTASVTNLNSLTTNPTTTTSLKSPIHSFFFLSKQQRLKLVTFLDNNIIIIIVIMARRDLEGGTKNRGYDPETQWTSWLVPLFVVANVAVFIASMYVNNCPRANLGSQDDCVARFLGRFSFQPLQENPLFGPSSST